MYDAVIDFYINTSKHLVEFPDRDKNPFAEFNIKLITLKGYEHGLPPQIIKEIEAWDKKPLPPLARVLLYFSWFMASPAIKNLPQGRTIIKKAIAVLPKDAPQIFKSSGQIYLSESEKRLSVDLLITEYEKYHKTSQRYELFMRMYFHFYSNRGMLNSDKVKTYFKKFEQNLSPEDKHLILFKDALSRCDFASSNEHMKYISKSPAYDEWVIINDLLQHNKFNIKDPNEMGQNKLIAEWAINHYIINKDLESAKKIKQNDYAAFYSNLWFEFSQSAAIRLELCCKNHEAALQLMRLRWQYPYFKHYTDYFFLSRIELLKGNREKAFLNFTEFYKQMVKHNALNRFNLEINMALELDKADIFELTKNCFELMNKKIELPDYQTRNNIDQLQGVSKIIGVSETIKKIKQKIISYANLDTTVLITGETGTGKEEVAKALHDESKLKEEPFLAINCAAITESLLQSELFGYEEGAFTGAGKTHGGIFIEAGKGTVFLDEIGEISPALQAALLRVLENKEVRSVGSVKSKKIKCRVIAATNKNLELMVKNKTFREDLFYRLNRLSIEAPPLRDHKEDVVPLTQYFLTCIRNNENIPILSPDLCEALTNHPWPGNIRQLKNEIEKLDLIQSRKAFYDVDDCDFLHKVKDVLTTENSTPKELHKQQTATINKSIKQQRHRLLEIKKLFETHKELSRIEIADILKISLPTITSDLKLLVKEGFIQKITPSPSPRTHYFIQNKK